MTPTIRIELGYDRRMWAASITRLEQDEETGSEYPTAWVTAAADNPIDATRQAMRGWREKRQQQRC